jgi:hypothetical protein
VGEDDEGVFAVREEARVPCLGVLAKGLDLLVDLSSLFWGEEGDLRFFEVLLLTVGDGSLVGSSWGASGSAFGAGALVSGCFSPSEWSSSLASGIFTALFLGGMVIYVMRYGKGFWLAKC